MAKRCLSILLAALALLNPVSVQAGDPPPFQEFTFKRVGVPKPGSARRITVQIKPVAKPVAKPAALKTPSPDVPAPKATAAFDWYWKAVSPSLTDAVPGRLTAALHQLGKGPGVSAPRLQHMQKIAERHGIDILAATIGTRVSPALVLAVIGIESAGRADAVSSAGAEGLMQLIPDTASRFGVKDSKDPTQNIRGGVAYLDWLMGEFAGDPIMVLAAYNAGENAVRRHDGVPPYAETRAYVPKVLAAWTVARGLCRTPPELISDGCVFAVSGTRADG